ncbi:MAG: cupin-like domain-containing protein [Acidobacteriaceae bacterium]|nr:cupin-like domain-containing protein [Acidobacteriaceae bacterium]
MTNPWVTPKLVRKLRKLEAVMAIYSELWANARRLHTIERRSNLSAEEFFRCYYFVNRPVIFQDGLCNSYALASWNPDYLKARCGNEIIEVMTGRIADPDYEINSEQHKTRTRMREFVDRVKRAGQTNDFYMVANNRSLESGKMKALLEEGHILENILDPARAQSRMFLWFGPAGTVTPLHHDTMNILLAQVYGRKDVTLIPSFHTPYVYNHIGVYSAVDCEKPDYSRFPLFRKATQLKVLLEPGQVLFIPVGWWHHVRSMDVSISLSFTNFRKPNDYVWD